MALTVNVIHIKSSQYEGWKAPKVVHPYLSYFGITNCCLVLLFNGFYVFVNDRFNIADMLTCYFAQILFLVLYVFWKILKKTHIRSDDEADIFTEKDEIDAEEYGYLEEEKNKPVRTGSSLNVEEL
jgi:amino acid permease